MFIGGGRPIRVFGRWVMEQIAIDAVKDLLAAQGMARTLRAFEASLFTAAVATGGAGSKKPGKYAPPNLAGTDDALPRLERMVLTLVRPYVLLCIVLSCHRLRSCDRARHRPAPASQNRPWLQRLRHPPPPRRPPSTTRPRWTPC